jgi:starvation-inducible DNA-binding protein
MPADIRINIGIDEKHRETIAEHLSRVLADTHLLYLKTHFYHWNVTGPMFSSLHLLFEKQYIELHEAVDMIAERIRALGHFAPGTHTVLAKLSTIPEDTDSGVPDALTMIRNLMTGHEALSRSVRAAFKAAEAGDDQATMDRMIERMEASDMAAWMLRSHLETPKSETMPQVDNLKSERRDARPH